MQQLKSAFHLLKEAREDAAKNNRSPLGAVSKIPEMDDAHYLRSSVVNKFTDLKNRLNHIRKKLDSAIDKIAVINNAIEIFEEWLNKAEQTIKSVYPKQVTDSEFSAVKEQCNVSQNIMDSYYVHTMTSYTYLHMYTCSYICMSIYLT